MNCIIKETVDSLLESYPTLELVKEVKKQVEGLLMIMNLATPANEEGAKQKIRLEFVSHCLNIAEKVLLEEN